MVGLRPLVAQSVSSCSPSRGQCYGSMWMILGHSATPTSNMSSFFSLYCTHNNILTFLWASLLCVTAIYSACHHGSATSPSHAASPHTSPYTPTIAAAPQRRLHLAVEVRNVSFPSHWILRQKSSWSQAFVLLIEHSRRRVEEEEEGGGGGRWRRKVEEVEGGGVSCSTWTIVAEEGSRCLTIWFETPRSQIPEASSVW